MNHKARLVDVIGDALADYIEKNGDNVCAFEIIGALEIVQDLMTEYVMQTWPEVVPQLSELMQQCSKQ